MTPAELRAYLRAWWGAVDGDRLRHVAILTYFGTYTFILLGGRETVNAALGVLPDVVAPGPLPPVAAALGLPVSVAWGVTSLVVALFAVGLVLAEARPDPAQRLPTRGGDGAASDESTTGRGDERAEGADPSVDGTSDRETAYPGGPSD